MSDRLNELRRQRGLQQEHLDWLDREIAALAGIVPPVMGTPPPPVTAGAPADDSQAEAILEEYRKPALSIQKQTKYGCILYFIVALGLLALCVVGMYVFAKARRGH